MTTKILIGDCIARMSDIEPGTVQTCVTSPPYWGLRDYGEGAQHGLEETPEAYVANMVQVFRAVRRCLRDDGTLWLNLGDSYGDKQLVGIPWRVAFALQADGWYLRSDIIWHKPNPMPESVTDRPTKGHEYVFLLSKSGRYFYDADAIREPATLGAHVRSRASNFKKAGSQDDKYGSHNNGAPEIVCDGTRNKRTVWTITTRPYSGAHFATMPPQLAELCIKAGTSEYGRCGICGAPYMRIKERISTGKRYSTGKSKQKNDSGLVTGFSGYDDGSSSPVFKTTGWEKRCECISDRVPCLVLDPYTGAGTTGLVAQHLRRSFVGCELNPEYAALAEKRIRMDSPLFSSVSMDEVTP